MRLEQTEMQEEREYLQEVISFTEQRMEELQRKKELLKGEVEEQAEVMREELTQVIRDFDDVIQLSMENAALTCVQKQYADNEKEYCRLQKLKESPYFARIDFVDREFGEENKVYIGASGLCDTKSYQMYICDWRAPVCELFYGFDTGEAWKGCLVNSFLPHNYSNSNCVTYTGTHDNDTTQGMLFSLNEECLCLVASYILGRKVGFEEASNLRHCGELCRQLVKICFSSVADFAIVPLQDIYCVDSSGRMNMPSTSGSNWSWRMSKEMLYGQWAEEKKEELKELNMLYAR